MAGRQAAAAGGLGEEHIYLCKSRLKGLQHERRAVSVMSNSATVVRVGLLSSLDFQQWLDTLLMTSLWQID